MNRNSRQHINTISLFSGAGGMDLGFAAGGFDIRCSVDIDPYSCRTLRTNQEKRAYLRKAPVLEKDISQLSAAELLASAGLKDGEVDFLIGGPPCQAFSVFGRRAGLEDPRGNLVWEYLRIVESVKPLGFVFENVAGLKTIHNGKLYRDLLEALSCEGEYVVSDHNYEVADYGIPQYRNRVFFIGHRHGRRIPPMAQTHGPNDSGLTPWITAKAVLDSMPEPGPNSGIPNHIGRVHSQRIIDRYRALEFGERDSKTRINKLHPQRPSFTIIVGSNAGGGKGHVHPYSPREVTPRESARLQTFPDWWMFDGTGRHVIRQVGNAVPPLFAGLLSQHVAHYMFERPSLSYRNLVDELELHYLRHCTR